MSDNATVSMYVHRALDNVTSLLNNVTSLSDNVTGSIENVTVANNISYNGGKSLNYLAESLSCVNLFIAAFAVVFGCVVIDVVRKLDNEELRSRFALLAVLVCDVILAMSNLCLIISALKLINYKLFHFMTCAFVYVNTFISSIFAMSLALSLLCLAVDQVIAVFKPFYFRMAGSGKRNLAYGVIIVMPTVLCIALLVYWTLEMKQYPREDRVCSVITKAIIELSVYFTEILVLISVATPVIYAVVLTKISRQTRVHSESRLDAVKNRQLVLTFFILSASYILFWMPTLVYFIICFVSGRGCWREDDIDWSIIMHIIFTFNYVVDPVVCAIRMEPINKKIRLKLGI